MATTVEARLILKAIKDWRHWVGNDMLDERPFTTTTRFAHFSEWYLVGFIQDDLYSITRMDGPESLYRLDDLTRDISDSIPAVSAEYSRRALAVYQSAYRNMKRNLQR